MKDINIDENNLRQEKDDILDKMFYSILPFRVRNHLFMSNRSQHESNMCKFCMKIYIKNKKLSGRINEKLFERKDDHFPVQFQD